MGLFSGITEAKEYSGGVYLTEGVYTDLEITAVKTIVTRKNEEMFCVEVLVHESTGPKAIMPGAKAAWMCAKKHDGFLGNVLSFMRPCAAEKFQKDIKSGDIVEDDMVAAVSSENPYAGTHMKATAVNIKTRKGADFTKVEWSPKTFVGLSAAA